MPSRTITDRQKAVAEVEAALKVFGPKLAAGLEGRLADALAAEEGVADLERFQRQILRQMRRLLARLEDADKAVSAAQRLHRGRCRRRDAIAGQLSEVLLNFRRALRSVYGRREGDAVLGFEGRLPVDPMRLLNQAEFGLVRLDGYGQDLPPMKFKLLLRKTAAWAEEFRTLTKDLRKKVDAIAEAEKILSGAQGKRRGALDEFNAYFVDAAGTLESHYRLAGLPEAAAALRPSKQDPGLTHRQSKRRRAAGKKKNKKKTGPSAGG